MRRQAYQELLQWKAKSNRKPLIIRGARQVGKTWLMKSFGENEYADTAYFNFESSPRLQELFQGDLKTDRILFALGVEAGRKITEETLIIFDEIQNAPQALTSLKYFSEEAPGYSILAAGSLLGVALHNHTSFPVGKVDFLDLYPLNFPEFLLATGEEALLALLEQQDWPLIGSFHDKFISQIKTYYYVGGMPEAVNIYREKKDLQEVRAIQKNILTAYGQDFSKHAPVFMVPRIRMLWDSLPGQLSKENKKFVYAHIKEGSRAKEFELAMTWLIDSGLLHKVNRIKKPSLPLKAYEDQAAFKLFLCDLGLLGAMADIDARSILEGNTLFAEFKGGLTEQYVFQQLITHRNWKTYYWSAENARAEIDFVLQIRDQVIPVEVKAEENLKSKSLIVYRDHFHPPLCVRSSLSRHRAESWLTNLPLYAIHELESLLVE